MIRTRARADRGQLPVPDVAAADVDGRAARYLSASDVAAIRAIIEGWPDDGRITWEELVRHVRGTLGRTWSRQALDRHAEIKSAYLQRRRIEREDPGRRKVDPAEVVQARHVASLKARIAELEERLAAYEAIFVRHQFNAERKGVMPGELDMPLPDIDRRRTDD